MPSELELSHLSLVNRIDEYGKSSWFVVWRLFDWRLGTFLVNRENLQVYIENNCCPWLKSLTTKDVACLWLMYEVMLVECFFVWPAGGDPIPVRGWQRPSTREVSIYFTWSTKTLSKNDTTRCFLQSHLGYYCTYIVSHSGAGFCCLHRRLCTSRVESDSSHWLAYTWIDVGIFLDIIICLPPLLTRHSSWRPNSSHVPNAARVSS